MHKTFAVPSLRRCGVSVDADLVFRALVMLGPQTSGQAARGLGVTPARVGRALDELSALGVVRTAQRPTGRWWSAAPDERVEAVLRRPPSVRYRPAHRWLRHMQAVAGIDLAAATVQRLPNRVLARQRIAELMATERHEHLAINTEEVISADAVRAALPLDRLVRQRGIRMRIVGLPVTEETYPYDVDPGGLTQWSHYRVADRLPLKFMVFDRRAALFPADPLNLEAGSVVVTDPATVEHFAHPSSTPSAR